MITTLTKECINGTLRAVENVVYHNGKHIKRVLNKHTGIPKEVIIVHAGKACDTQSAIALFLAKAD